jgi:Tol biopolymer transport system component
MAMMAGSRLGPYEIIAPLGAGGMGEVYKARDTRLDRTVAIKVLPDGLAADPQFRERFDREARTISRLAHPNICTLFDVGEEAGTAFLVMELLEGETLESRCARANARGSGLPLEEAMRIAMQMADALAAAHRQGIVHRDLKPSNIFLVRREGASAPPIAKLLDFGLARTAPALTVHGATSTPTTLAQTMTAQGTILGTFQYMAPEQVEGGLADARTDIFAFGSVLYEMITGKKAFEGKTQTSLVAAILERDPPPLTTVQPLAPPLVDSIVRKCVAKNPDDRWQTASDLGSALRWTAEGTNATTSGATAVGGTPRTGGRRVANGALVAGILGSVAIGIAVGSRYMSTVATPAALVRFEVQPPADVTLTPAPIASAAQLALSPDGRRLAFVATRKRAVSQLWIRSLDDVQTQPLPGTEGASYPFWSPDNRFIAFFAGGKLKKIDTTGGVPQVLCASVAGRGGTWNRDGIILFVGRGNSPISRIAASGGAVTTVTTFDPAQVFGHSWPQFLPDGRHFLYYQRSSKREYQGVYVTALDSSSSTGILESDGMAVYASGHLVFVRDGTLFAQAFDDRALQTGGDPVRIGDHVGYWTAGLGYAAVTASAAGLLAHGPSVRLTTSLRWFHRSGASAGPPTSPAQYTTPRLSPDQANVVVAMTDGATAQPDLWVLGVARGTMSRVTTDPATDWFPAWSADGSRLLFGSNRLGMTMPFQKVLGGGPEEPAAASVFSAAMATSPIDVSNDGGLLLYTQLTTGGYDLGVLTLTGERKASTFLGTPFNEVQGRFSPNTRWVAYASDESGTFEVYVRPFPPASGQTQISIAGGTQPEWRRDGKELFYIAADGKLTAVPVTTDGTTFSAGTPRALFDVEVPEPNPPFPTDYAVTTDGQRFLFNTVVDQPTRPALTVILNWTADFKK